LAALVNGVTSPDCPALPCNFSASAPVNPTLGTAPGDISPIAYGLLNYKLPNGQFLFPSANSFVPTISFPENTFTPGTAYFQADQAVSDLDWIATAKDTVALKYYYQHDPSIAPYAYSGSPGFSQHLDAGSQVASITNTQIIKPNLSVVEVFGYIREKVYSTVSQPFTPQQFGAYVQQLTGASAADSTINTFGSPFFPGISIVDDYGNNNAGFPQLPTTKTLSSTPPPTSAAAPLLKVLSPASSKIASCRAPTPSGLSASTP
jgi:hypothetical protein